MNIKSDIAMIGMAVMGSSLALNMEEHGFKVSIYDVRDGIVDSFLEGEGKGKNFFGAHSLRELVDSLKRPRIAMMMIKAGDPVDQVTENLLPLLEKGDIIVDGGNSFWQDTDRRVRTCEEKGIHFIGMGVSGGEMGARRGPSLMPGGSREAWEAVKPIFLSICAKSEGDPCCGWTAEGGAGHYVKMVHNGIEYGDMELICESWWFMKNALGLTDEQAADVFETWNKGKLDSYLVSITADILRRKDDDGQPLVEKILDTAGQKGTGKWASQSALDMGVPLTLITDAVFERCMSARKKDRLHASRILTGPEPEGTHGSASGTDLDADVWIPYLEDALYAAKICSYAQGFRLLAETAKNQGWELDYGQIALMWRGGCIIRSRFLGEIRRAYDRNPDLENLLLDDFFRQEFGKAQKGLRMVAAEAIREGIPAPALSSAVSYYDALRSSRLPANLLQAQRDYFGAHTYERIDGPEGKHFHTEWES